ncbi:hypothetical protein QEN19_000365 [Hanseniaspora menglaensis]
MTQIQDEDEVKSTSICINPSYLQINKNIEEKFETEIISETIETYNPSENSSDSNSTEGNITNFSASSLDKKDLKLKPPITELNKENLDIMDSFDKQGEETDVDQNSIRQLSSNAINNNQSSNTSVVCNDKSRSNLLLQAQNVRFNQYNNSIVNHNSLFNSDPNTIFYNQSRHVNLSQASGSTDEISMDNGYFNGNSQFQLNNNLSLNMNSAGCVTPNFTNSPFTPGMNNLSMSPFGSMSGTVSNDPQKVIHVPVPVPVPVFMPYNSRNGNNVNESNMIQQYMHVNQFNRLNNTNLLPNSQVDFMMNQQQQMMQFQNRSMGSDGYFPMLNNQKLQHPNDVNRINTPNITNSPLITHSLNIAHSPNTANPLATNETNKSGNSKAKKKRNKSSKNKKSSITTLTITKDSSAASDNNLLNNNITDSTSMPVDRPIAIDDTALTSLSDAKFNLPGKTPIDDHNVFSELVIESLQRQRNQGKLIHLDPVPNFEDKKDVKLWLQKIFYPLGIEIAIERSDKAKISFKCKALKRSDEEFHHDHHHGSKELSDDSKNDEIKSKRVKSPFNTCPFRIRASYRTKSEKWQIVILNNSHSHQLKFNPNSVNYKQFKQVLRDMNDIDTVKKFDELEYKSKMNIPMLVDTIPCDCGLTEEVQSFGVVLPSSLTSSKQQNSVLGRFNQKNNLKKNTSRSKLSEDSNTLSTSSGVIKSKKQPNKGNKMLDTLRKHVTMSSISPANDNNDSSEQQNINDDRNLTDFSDQFSKVDCFLAGQKSTNIPDYLGLHDNADILGTTYSAQENESIKPNNNFLNFDTEVDEVDFTELFLNPHKKGTTNNHFEATHPGFSKTDEIDLENLSMQFNGIQQNSSMSNQELTKELDEMHLFENSQNGSYFF